MRTILAVEAVPNLRRQSRAQIPWKIFGANNFYSSQRHHVSHSNGHCRQKDNREFHLTCLTLRLHKGDHSSLYRSEPPIYCKTKVNDHNRLIATSEIFEINHG
jgi:hypothetical protein